MAKREHEPDDRIVKLVDALLLRALDTGASDAHFEPTDDSLRVRFRLDGLLHEADRLPITVADNVIARLKVLAGLLTYRLDVPQEGSFVTRGVDVRVAVFPTVRGERAAVRLLPRVGEVSGLDDLGFAEAMVADLGRAAEQPSGMILVTGPAGAGKSTTLYALARHILTETPGRCVVSLEDPVEQRIDGLTQIQVQPHGELNYARAMRSLLRQDVQVLLVGEIRDAETAHVVTEAALTGHLVMSTLHSGDPAEALARLLEMGIAPYQVVSAVTRVGAQRLVRRVCSSCGGAGCDVCVRTGYRGRVACGQLVTMSADLRAALLERATTERLRRVLSIAGPDLAQDAARLVEAGVTTVEEVLRVLGIGVPAAPKQPAPDRQRVPN